MDRDKGSIGGLEIPPSPTPELFYVTVFLDTVSILLSLLVSWIFTLGIVAYILASRAYSARTIRLKKYPVTGYLTVIIFQGALTWYMVYHGASYDKSTNAPVTGVLAAMLLIGGFYPLTQIYQHEADKQDGIKTISMELGYRGTFIFTAVVYMLAMGTLYIYFNNADQHQNFLILATAMLPVLVYFFYWAAQVWKNPGEANYSNTMRMNLLASLCTIAGFLIILIRRSI